MTLTYRSLASNLLLVAVTLSASFQLYRASLDTPYAVDRFGATAAVAYAVLFAVALAVRTDRRWVWWSVGLLLTLNLVFGVVGYYPRVYAARPMGLLDWAEGTAYTGLLLAALGCVVLNLTGTTLAASAGGSSASRTGAPSPVDRQPSAHHRLRPDCGRRRT